MSDLRQIEADLLEPLRCPGCALGSALGKLEAVEQGLRCTHCDTHYPNAGSVHCLMPEPARYCLSQFRNLEEYLAVTALRQRDLAQEQRQEHLLSSTRERLRRLLQALDVERALVSELLADLTASVDRSAAAAVPHSPFPARDLTVLSCHETTFRDWAWGDVENEFGRAMVERLATQAASLNGKRLAADLGQLAVFGAGACRLAVDAHRTLRPTRTFALDINPLPVLIADRIVRGETVKAYDYPIGPHSVEGVAVLQQLARSFEIPEGLVLLLANALHPPFAAASLDSVLTPWFIDVVGADLRDTAAIVNRVLRTGGLWLNQGPLRFAGRVSSSYVIEEVLEIVSRSGFEVIAESTEDTPYFASPISGSHRIETVYGFAARKRTDAPRPLPPTEDPPWAVNPLLPIPRPPGLGATQERFAFNAGVLSLIDSQRSLSELAIALGLQLKLNPQTLVEPLRAFLLKFFQAG